MRAIAEQIWRERHERLIDSPGEQIIGRQHELPHEDEARVVAALAELMSARR